MARSFNGSSDIAVADAAHGFTLTTAFTVAFWVKGSAQTNVFVYSEGNSGSASANSFGIGTADVASTQRVHVFMRNNANSVLLNAYTTALVFDNTWHHVVYTQNSSGAGVYYIDGAFDSNTSYTQTGTCTTNRTGIGALRRSSNAAFFAGGIAELATWTRQLSASEAAALGAGAIPSLFAPSHYWPLWGTDSAEPDIVGGGTNATLTGTTSINGPPVYLPRFSSLYGHTAISAGVSKTGFGDAGAFGAGDAASIFVEEGFGTVGGVGAGSKTVTGQITKRAAGIAVLIGGGANADTSNKTGYALVGTVGGGARQSSVVPVVIPGRVLIAWDDGPLAPNPTWTSIDLGLNGFPDQFVAGYDTKNGRQTLISQTETGTATVYINDHELGLFDDRNMSSPYQGKLSGRQIMLQLLDPVTDVWEPQFRGLINDYSYDIDGSASNAQGEPINASIQIECVDMFDYLEGFGLTPGLAGVTPPAGAEDGVYYAATGVGGSVDDRIIEILADANVDSSMYGSPGLASGNVKVVAVKYDPGESALTAIRDAVDAEFPFLGICYCDRFGKFQFRGRYGRFDPDAVSGEPGSEWDFTRWKVGDENAILSDPTRAQMRALGFARARSNVINVAMSWPQSLPAADMPNQVFADTASITAYGQHAAPPMSDLLTADYVGPGTITPSDGKTQCYLYAKLLVKNQAFPREAITTLQVKAIPPDDARAAATWAFITRSDISHIVNVAVGYPGGTGFAGNSPQDDYYIEGRSLVVRPLNPAHDYVEYNTEVSPAVWSMDTDGVFPPHP